VRLVAVGTLILLTLLVPACSTSATRTTQKANPDSSAAVPSIEPSGTFHGWFGEGVSKTPGPDGVIGSFSVRPALEDSRVPSPQLIYVTTDTTSTIPMDRLLEKNTAVGNLLFIDYHLAGSKIIAERISAPLGVAY